MFGWFKKNNSYVNDLATILSQQNNKEDLLGVKAAMLPTPDDIRNDAARLYRYSQSGDYKRFAEEAWSRIISDLDVIMNDKTSSDSVAYHRGAVKRTLDLLRISYQAKLLMDSMNEERQTSSRS